MRKTWLSAVLAMVAMVAVISAGCGGSNSTGGMTILNAAAQKCGSLLRAAMEGHS